MIKDLREWLWRGRALDAARSRWAAGAKQEDARLRARAALELGARAHEPSQPFASGPDLALACELYRQASYWALVALTGSHPGSRSQSELWEATDPALLLKIAGSSDRLDRLRDRLNTPSFVDYTVLSPDERAQAAAELGAWAQGLVAEAGAPEEAVRRLRAQRSRRLGLLLLLLGVFVFSVGPRVGEWLYPRPDLAVGRPWRASSEYIRCSPEERRCGDYIGLRIFFHTLEEKSPWLEIDLQEKMKISSVVVRNRTDCCSERALPLVVEISNDHKRWRKAARRKTDFRDWTAEFTTRNARWVRLRVDGTSTLHLERVSIYH